jgi:spore coat polysaccharide biosynthesis predicted glycosyltransferase SpsG
MMHPEFLPVTTAEDISDFVSAMRSRGFRGDLLVCDHYGLTFDWYRAIRPEFTSVATIDDLADRRLDTDLLLDQNFYAGLEHRYDGLLPATARKLLGPAYALLRDSFARARTGFNRNSPGERPHHFVVSFGGRELKDCNLPVARCLLRNTNAAVTVLGTPDPANVTAWESLRTLYPGRLAGPIYCQDPATLFTEATAYAGAGGSVTWERCALGLPGIVFAIAENQRSMSRDTADAGFQIYLGDFRDFNESSLMDAVQKLSDKAAYETMVKKMLGLVDGKGVRRVVDELERLVSR